MENTHPDGNHFICPDCSHEWLVRVSKEEVEEIRVHKDAHENILHNREVINLIKDLKVKESSFAIKTATKIKNTRLVDSDHDINCKVDSQSMSLKFKFIKKALK
jgi:protein PhnA